MDRALRGGRQTGQHPGGGLAGAGADGVGCGELGGDGGALWELVFPGGGESGEFEAQGAGDGAVVGVGAAEKPVGISAQAVS